jgi:hypothetical protein
MNEVLVRAPKLDDAHRVAAQIAERDGADFAEVDSISFTLDELREWWRPDEAVPETDAWIALLDALYSAHQQAFAERWEFTPHFGHEVTRRTRRAQRASTSGQGCMSAALRHLRESAHVGRLRCSARARSSAG